MLGLRAVLFLRLLMLICFGLIFSLFCFCYYFGFIICWVDGAWLVGSLVGVWAYDDGCFGWVFD